MNLVNILIQAALSQRLMTMLLTGLMALIGILSLRQLPVDAFPDISPTQVKVIIKAPGMTPEEVESLITQPLEIELLGIPQQTILRSTSRYALSAITLDFTEDSDIYWARQQVAERVNATWERLPEGVSGGLAPMSTPLSEMFMFTVDNDALSLSEKRFLLDWQIRPALRTVPGVADVNALGGEVRSYEVSPRPEQMARLGIRMDTLIDTLRANNRNDGAGRIDQGEEAILVRVSGAVTSLADLRASRIHTPSGEALSLGDIANIRMGSLERYGGVTADGQGESVQGLVVALRGANARDVAAAVAERLQEIEASLPEGTRLRPFYDRSILVDGAVSTVSIALLQAVVLVAVLLALFLGDLRAALTVALVLPFSALMTFLLMNLSGLSANLMSLGGLVIAIGLLVDSAIVVVDNIVNGLGRPQAQRLPALHVIFRAVREVAPPVLTGVAVISIVFLPLLSLEGLEGKLFQPVTLTIIFALLSALLLALTAIPVLASWLLKTGEQTTPWLHRQTMRLYQPLLEKALAMPALMFSLAGLLLLLTIVLYPLTGKTFMPVMDEGDIILQTESIPSINLDSSLAIMTRVEQALLAEVPDLLRVVTRTGTDELGMDPMGLNESDLFLQLKPPQEWQAVNKAGIEAQLRQVMDRFHGLNYGLTQPIDMRVSEMLTGSRGDLAIKVFGDNLQQLNDIAQQITTLISALPGSVDTLTQINEGAHYLQIEIDRFRASELGLSVEELQRYLRAGIEGLQAGTVIEGNARIPLVLRLNKPLGDAGFHLQHQSLSLPDGRVIALGEVASLQQVEGPVSISRENGQRFAVVRTNVAGRDLVNFVAEARQVLAESLSLPLGFSLTWGGEFENQQRAAARLGIVVPLALLLITLILFMQFRSLSQTLIILSNLPFAMTGGIIALWMTGEYLSVPAAVGFIALLGIAVLNGVVMLSHFNTLKARGLPVEQVVVEGALRRLRPVLMTATTCAFGLLPLLLASGPGSEIQKPLAIVVIGGLTSSTLLTLFLLPVIYTKVYSETP